MAGITNTIIGSTFACLGHAKRLAIASKEPIIIGGKFLKTMAEQTETEILPVDSEHSAIFQCLVGEDEGAVERLILTASGGPFLGLDEPELDVRATIEETLNHPKWNMGSKISVDSATMINKAFEIIEAAILFDIDINRIIPVIHPESVIHGLVEFTDGNVKAVMSPADMNFPISYAMNYPFRSPLPGIRRLDLSNLGNIQFVDQKDWQRKNIDLGYRAFRENKSIAFVVADAVAVDGFLNGKIRFTQIHQIIDKILDISQTEKIESYSDIAMLSDEYCRMVPAAVG
jgi:1-deoxy-D-xylulose-5-phosphate reductoisomerase